MDPSASGEGTKQGKVRDALDTKEMNRTRDAKSQPTNTVFSRNSMSGVAADTLDFTSRQNIHLRRANGRVQVSEHVEYNREEDVRDAGRSTRFSRSARRDFTRRFAGAEGVSPGQLTDTTTRVDKNTLFFGIVIFVLFIIIIFKPKVVLSLILRS